MHTDQKTEKPQTDIQKRHIGRQAIRELKKGREREAAKKLYFFSGPAKLNLFIIFFTRRQH